MKKIIYLCSLILFCMNGWTQISTNDQNWKSVLNDDFTTNGRTWNMWTFVSSDNLWRAYPGYSVSNDDSYQVFQPANCHFNDADSLMELVAEYDSQGKIARNDYYLPSWMLAGEHPIGYPDPNNLFYFSGEIDCIKGQNKEDVGIFHYGYFEIRCKLPIHAGAFPAFWLYDSKSHSKDDSFYEEIDIFEYSWGNGDPSVWWIGNLHPTYPGDPYIVSSGIYQNLTGEYNPDRDSYARSFFTLPYSSGNVSGWHTYSCEWMPDHIYWFVDGQMVNRYFDVNHIPRHPLMLKIDYAINEYALDINDTPQWTGTDKMTIDYVKAYEMKWDCDSDEIIESQLDLDNFDYAVKRSISINSSNSNIEISNSDGAFFRFSDSFQITGGFQVDFGGEFAAIQQDCPDDDNE